MYRLLAAAVAAVALLATPAYAKTKIRLGHTITIGYLGAFIAQEKGYFAQHDLDVELIPIGLNSTIPAALVGNSLDIGGPTTSVMLQAIDGGIDLVAIANCSVNNVEDKTVGVLVRKGSGIKQASDLVGKKVGAPGLGAYLHIMFQQWLKDQGVDYKRVQFVEVSFPQIPDVLKSGTIDAALTGNPGAGRIVKDDIGDLLAPYLSQMRHGVPAIVFSASRKWTQDHPKEVAGFRAALQQAVDYAQANPEEARQIAAKYVKMPPDLMATLLLPTLQVGLTKEDITYWIDMMRDQSLLTTDIKAESVLAK